MRLTSLAAAVAVVVWPLTASAQQAPYVEKFPTIEKAVEATKESKKDIILEFSSDS